MATTARTTARTTVRTVERTEFLADVLVTAIENYGYGQFRTLDYAAPEGEPANYSARIKFYGEPEIHPMTVDTIAAGIGVIDRAIIATDDTGETFLVNASTFERLNLSTVLRKDILDASTENDAGEIDVIGALAILECAVFGRVVYA